VALLACKIFRALTLLRGDSKHSGAAHRRLVSKGLSPECLFEKKSHMRTLLKVAVLAPASTSALTMGTIPDAAA
jgi:hypothetical protein